LQKWRTKDPELKALKAAVKVARKGRDSKAVSALYPAWDQLRTKTRNNMWRYAQAATLKARCLRAGFAGADDGPDDQVRARKAYNRYLACLAEADRFGVKKDVQRFAETPRKKCSKSGVRWGKGWISDHLYVPSSCQLGFREEALERAGGASLHLSSALKDLPAYYRWFEAVTTPPSWSYDAAPAVQSADEEIAETDTSELHTADDPPSAEEEGTGAASKYPGHRKKPHTTGPIPDPEREHIIEYCYDGRKIQGLGRSKILSNLQKLYPNSPNLPKHTDDIPRLVKEWANRHVPPLPLVQAEARERFQNIPLRVQF
jgi:hypothetical protein